MIGTNGTWAETENSTGTNNSTGITGVKSVSKTAKPTTDKYGKIISNQYDVTLKVELEQTTSTTLPGAAATVLVMDHFSGVRMDVLFSYLKKAGIPSIDLKAIVTDTNADWTFFALYQEIAKEHARMHARRAIVTRIEESDFGCEGRPDGVIAMDHVYLRYEQESEEFCLMAEDDQLYADHNR